MESVCDKPVSNSSPTNKFGLVLVKTKLTDKGLCSCPRNLEGSKPALSCKWDDKWILFAALTGTVSVEAGSKISEKDSSDNLEKSKGSVKFATLLPPKTNILNQPHFQKNIVEMHLDGVLKDKSFIKLSDELFKCVNLHVLSLRNNNLRVLPVEIGRLTQLRKLLLTENCLTFNTIPYTLTFCKNLKILFLDHNLLEALPGFLLEMPQLETVYRHGNDNYFKSTFLWFHTSERDRVVPIPSKANKKAEEKFQPESLDLLAIKSVIESKVNFFTPGLLPATLQEHIAQVYNQYRICAFCCSAFHKSKLGYGVFTFKDGYVGNSCVPFEFWTCSKECGKRVEEPSHQQERIQSKKQDNQYQQYIYKVQEQFNRRNHVNKELKSCVLM